MRFGEATVRRILTRTSGYLRDVTSHSLQPYRGCSFGNALCGAGCYVRASPWVTRGEAWGSFLEAYLARHLAPLLRSEWQSRHPELAALDASLRLLEAEVRVELRDTGRVQEQLDELARRFAGRESLLVDYPVGKQTPLGTAIEGLRKRKWRG